MGGGEVFVCRLDDNDSNFYLDGSPADLTGQEGDVMVVFLEFWYKWYKVDDNKFLYHFADHNIDGTYIHVPQSLVGAYKGYVSSNRLYSWSDVTPTTNVSLSDFRSYAKARGTGFQVIDFQQHCVIAMMLYAKYKTRNLQGVLGPGGAGSSPATTTGSSNATGGADTKNESSKYVCGLGLEGVFGGICEWVEGVEINNRVWKITDPDGSTRNVNAETFSGWIINIAAENGPFFDVCRHKLAVAIPRIIQITIVGHQTAPLFWRAPVTARIRLAAWRIRMRLTMRRTWIRATVLVLLSTEPYP